MKEGLPAAAKSVRGDAPDPGLGKNRDTPTKSAKSGKPVVSNRTLVRVSTASRLMAGHWKKTGENIKGSSVLGCGRWKAYGSDPDFAEIEVVDGVPRMLGHFLCKAVWACPFCERVRVAQTRSWIRCALIPAMDEQNLTGSLLTFTLSHSYSEDWAGVVERLLTAFKRADKALDRPYKAAGSVGKLRALEAPVGVNGLHPHLHVLLVHSRDADLIALEAAVSGAWEQAVLEVGGSLNEHGFDFKADCVNDYAAKMETAHEMAANGTKSARRKGSTLVQLLDRAAVGDQESGDKWIRAQLALGGRRRFHAGALPKKLGIVCPSLWEDEEIQAVRDARKLHQEEPVIIRYPQIRHLKATGTVTRRPGLAMILRAARAGKSEIVLSVVDALCADTDKNYSAQTFTDEYLCAVFEAAKLRPLSRSEVMAYLDRRRPNFFNEPENQKWEKKAG